MFKYRLTKIENCFYQHNLQSDDVLDESHIISIYWG